jgi:lipoate-protein ligase A
MPNPGDARDVLRTPAWRLIVDGRCDGAWNMAVDRALQMARESGEAPPTLRLYGWSVPTLTLGRFQEAEGIDSAECRRRNVAVVRRATGGRGVVHDDEVTYSVIASTGDGVPQGTAASYRHLGAGVVEAYAELGVNASVTSRSRGRTGTASCYLQSTQADVSAGSAKLSGSAQVWHGTTCLQHGSFTRTRDLDRERAVFRLDSDEVSALREAAVTLEDLCDVAPGEARIVDSAVAGFARGLGVHLQPGGLSQQELDLAHTLLRKSEIEVA